MSDLASEVRAYIHVFKIIRRDHPSLPRDDEHFEGSLKAECSLHSIINAMVREFRQESTLEAAMDQAVQDMVSRWEGAGRRAEKILLQLQATLQKIEKETGETPEFQGASYLVTLNGGTIDLKTATDKAKPIHERSGAKKIEALYLQRLEAKAKIDQIKAEEAVLKEIRQRLLSEVASIDQQVIEEAPSLFSPGMKTAKLPMVDITVSDMPDDVVITDFDVLADKYIIEEPPPPPPPPKKKANIPALLMDLKNKVDVFGAHLTNGGKRVSYRVKKPS